MSEQEVKEKSQAIQETVKEILRQADARTLMAYVSVRKEVETREFIRCLLAQGVRVAVPLCIPERVDLIPCQLEDFERDLTVGTFGIPEPGEGRRRFVPVEDLQVVLVPGVAFDLSGFRLGHGSGYYDRFLGRLSPKVRKVGLAYDWQIVQELPRETHDVPVDLVVTETRTIVCECVGL